LGNPSEFTVVDLAQIVLKLVGSSAEITFHPLPEDDPKRRCPDISTAKRVLNWQPEVILEDGISKTIEYFKKKVQAT